MARVRGFSLIEVLLVLVVLGLSALTAVDLLGLAMRTQARTSGLDAALLEQAGALEQRILAQDLDALGFGRGHLEAVENLRLDSSAAVWRLVPAADGPLQAVHIGVAGSELPSVVAVRLAP